MVGPSCQLGAFHASHQTLASFSFLPFASMSLLHVEPVFSCCELDSHANTCALGMNFALLSYTGHVCDVTPYNADHGFCEKNVPIITGATSYTCQSTGQMFILIINEGPWFDPKLFHTL